MSHLENKSDINCDSAKVLHNSYNYPSVAHCAYYSCYQRIKHVWLYHMNKTEAELKQLVDSNKRDGSHDVLINQIVSFTKNNVEDYRVINNNIGQLKKLRRKADYDDENFDSQKSQQSLDLMNIILPVLKKYK